MPKARGRNQANLLILFALAFALTAEAKQKNFIAHINGELWGVRFVKVINDDKAFEVYDGWTNCEKREIQVKAGTERQYQAKVILHEIQHAFTCLAGTVHNQEFNNDDEADTHEGIYFAAPKWLEFIQANKELIRWIWDSEPPKIEIVTMPMFESCRGRICR